MKSHSNMVSQKKDDNSSAAELKDMEYCNLTDKEFKIAVMEKKLMVARGKGGGDGQNRGRGVQDTGSQLGNE